MAATFKFHSSVGEVVPFNAQYAFPSQATKIQKQTVKLPAKNGSEFKEGSVIRIEFPADDYLNVLNSYLVFDAEFTVGSATRIQWQRGGANNAIKRLRVLYGGLVLEDIQEYKTIVRMLSECTMPQDYRESTGGILDGMSANVNYEPGATAYYGAGYSERSDLTGILIRGIDAKKDKVVIRTPGTLTSHDIYDNCMLELIHTQYSTAGANSVLSSTRAVLSTKKEIRYVIRSDPSGVAGEGPMLTLDQPLDAITAGGTNGVYPFELVDDELSNKQRTFYRIIFPGAVDYPVVLPESTLAADIALAGPEYGASERRRTYCLNLLAGLFTQKKLVPLKWMAAQLAVEITVATVGDAALFDNATEVALKIHDPQFVAELISFDSTYDQAFYMGLEAGGVPLKFASFHFHSFNVNGNSNTVQIHERSRSIKCALAVVRDQESQVGLKDSDRFFHALGQTIGTNGLLDEGRRTSAAITEFQWRVGGRYYPSQPVRCTMGAAEAYVELLKALNQFGDYTCANAINIYNWSSYGSGMALGDKFIIAAEFENTDIVPGTIAGINGEEQSDIALTIRTNGSIPTEARRTLDVFIHYDAMIIVRDGNHVDLIM